MPYIHKFDRELLDVGNDPDTPGQLNYLFTKIINQYLKTNGLSYHSINDCLGALEGAKMEFNRRVVIPYEDQAIIRNGDVYNKEFIGGK